MLIEMQQVPKGIRLVLALTFILVLGSSVQGYPTQRARYQWVRCNPDSISANCIEETGPLFDLSTDGSNNIRPPMKDPVLMRRLQNWNDVFPISEEYSGSGSGSPSGSGSASGSGSGSGSGNGFLADMEWGYQPVDEDDGFDYFRSPERKLLMQNQEQPEGGFTA